MAYSCILTAGVLTGVLFSLLLSHRKGFPALAVLDAALAAGAGGVLVGRALYVLAHLAYFQEHPAESLALWRGGLSGVGVVVGGLAGLLALSARRHTAFRPILNVLAPGASLVVIAAWLGCLRVGCAWGQETWPGQGLLWSLSLDLPDLYGLRAPRVAVQVMGALWGTVLLLASSLALRFRWHSAGLLWLFLYGLGDFALSFLRGDLSRSLGGLSLLQWADLGLALGALFVFLLPGRKGSAAGKTVGRSPHPTPQPPSLSHRGQGKPHPPSPQVWPFQRSRLKNSRNQTSPRPKEQAEAARCFCGRATGKRPKLRKQRGFTAAEGHRKTPITPPPPAGEGLEVGVYSPTPSAGKGRGMEGSPLLPVLRGWGTRAILFLLLLLTLRAPRVLVVVGPPREVHTTNPLVGVHTRLTDEVEEWKIQRTLQMVREMGAPWIVEYFPWAYIEPRPGQFDWEHSDIVVRHARAQGLTVIARLGFVPGWARPEETTPSYIDPEFYDEFAAFVAAFLARYRGEINHVIIWNEPNLSLEWGYRPVDPAAYTEMLKVVYPAARAANPDVVVLAGALAPTLEPPGSPAGLNDLDYLEGMYAAGAAPYFDALAVHAYGTTFPPEADPAPDVINFRRTELLRAIMEAHGDGHKPVYITEGGWNDHPRWTRAVRPAQRVAYTIGAYEWARQHWPWCRAVAFWAFRYPAPLRNFQDYYTFVTDDFRPKPIYLAVQEYTGNDGMTE